jgi:hypothetical protein
MTSGAYFIKMKNIPQRERKEAERMLEKVNFSSSSSLFLFLLCQKFLLHLSLLMLYAREMRKLYQLVSILILFTFHFALRVFVCASRKKKTRNLNCDDKKFHLIK